VLPFKAEQYIKHFVSAGLLRLSSGVCLQEVTLRGKRQKTHQVDFISSSHGVTRAIEFKYRWIGTQNKKTSAAGVRKSLDAAWRQVDDIQDSALQDEGISRRMALSMGMPWFKAKKGGI
jgi:hypothetical protein